MLTCRSTPSSISLTADASESDRTRPEPDSDCRRERTFAIHCAFRLSGCSWPPLRQYLPDPFYTDYRFSTGGVEMCKNRSCAEA
jgi:hypothetical protein